MAAWQLVAIQTVQFSLAAPGKLVVQARPLRLAARQQTM